MNLDTLFQTLCNLILMITWKQLIRILTQKNIAKSNIVFIAQLVERLYNCIISYYFLKMEIGYTKKGIFLKKQSVKSQPGSPETSFSLKFPPGFSPFGTPPELVVRAYTNPISQYLQVYPNKVVQRCFLFWRGLQGLR